MDSTHINIAAIKQFGEQKQIEKLFEEMAELQVAVCHYREKRGGVDDIAQEICDVSIMLEQLIEICNCRERVCVWREYKLNRLQSRISIAKQMGKENDT